jgi:acetyltransferase EpsM
MREFLIIGGGAQGRLITEIVNNHYKHYTVVVANTDEDIGTDIKEGIIAIGDNKVRAKVRDYVLKLIPDFQFKYIIHPSAIIGCNVKIGLGCMIMPNTIIQRDTRIGEHCLINTGAIIEHDNDIMDYVNIQPRVTTGGGVHIGHCASIGMGALIRDHISIASKATIGMGSVVLKSIGANLTAWGNPAKIINK